MFSTFISLSWIPRTQSSGLIVRFKSWWRSLRPVMLLKADAFSNAALVCPPQPPQHISIISLMMQVNDAFSPSLTPKLPFPLHFHPSVLHLSSNSIPFSPRRQHYLLIPCSSSQAAACSCFSTFVSGSCRHENNPPITRPLFVVRTAGFAISIRLPFYISLPYVPVPLFLSVPAYPPLVSRFEFESYRHHVSP